MANHTGKGTFQKGHDDRRGKGGARPGSGRKPSEFKAKLQRLCDFYDECVDGIIEIARTGESEKNKLAALIWCAEMVTPKRQVIEHEPLTPDDGDIDPELLERMNRAAEAVTKRGKK